MRRTLRKLKKDLILPMTSMAQCYTNSELEMCLGRFWYPSSKWW